MGSLTRVKIDGRGRIAIPREMLASLDLKTGDALVMCTASSKRQMLLMPEEVAIHLLEKGPDGRDPGGHGE